MNSKVFLVGSIAVLSMVWGPALGDFSSAEVKCHVCKATVREMEQAVAKVNPHKRADVGYRMDGKTVKLVKSEMYLTELMENICKKMDDYVKATYKTSGKFTLLKLIVDGKMNSESSNVDFVQDGDLNKSLAHYCLEILDDHEEIFLEVFQAETLDDNLDIKICSERTKYCNEIINDEL